MKQMLCVTSIFLLEMDQNQQSMLDQKLFQSKCDIRLLFSFYVSWIAGSDKTTQGIHFNVIIAFFLIIVRVSRKKFIILPEIKVSYSGLVRDPISIDL